MAAGKERAEDTLEEFTFYRERDPNEGEGE